MGIVRATSPTTGGGGGGGSGTDPLAVHFWVPTASKTANYTAAAGELVRCDPTGGAFTVTLPGAPSNGARVAAKITTATAPNAVAVVTQGSDVFNRAGGPTSRSLSVAGEAAVFEYDSSTGIWTVVGSDTPVGSLDGRYAQTLILPLGRNGVLSATVGTMRLPITRAATIVRVRAMVGTAPTGASLIVDVNKNGTTIFTTQANRPTIAASANDSGAGTPPNVTTLAAGDYLSLDVDQVGSTVQGSDLTVAVEVR